MDKKTFLRLDSPVQYVKGIGPRRSACLAKIGVQTVQDLLRLVPRRYVDYSAVSRIRDVRIDQEATVIGTIQACAARRTRNRMSLITAVIRDASGSIALKWFNRPDLKNKLKPGDLLIVSGRVTFYQRAQFVNPLYELLTAEETVQDKKGSVIPIYPLTEGLSNWDIRRAVRVALEACRDAITESLPGYLVEKNGLLPLCRALQGLHFPASAEEAAAARHRLVYDEFFLFELTLAQRKAELQDRPGIPFRLDRTLTRRFVEALPFQLTAGQAEAIASIERDMSRPQPMNRLLQGDVGSGKTVVALYAILIALENDYQGVLMAPTEILAEQHSIVLREMLAGVGIEPCLLTGSVKGREHAALVEQIASGQARLVLGTHALLEQDVVFHRLGLVVVDEQHRFGVMQRAALVSKGVNPDFLVLSATPIPRTLALTLYGDLDVSIIREKPPERGEVVTKIVADKDRTAMYRAVRGILARGFQAFVICPIIEPSETMELRSVEEVTTEIRAHFPEFKVGVIHGRLDTASRIEIMNEYRLGKTSILVATTVIEVGVDIPNATVMLIFHPERFGLAQLHQLRGRIGRGDQRSHCYLVVDRFLPPETYERISFFEQNNDGFALAQKDFRLRGPGEVLGRRQHGLPDIEIGDLEYDREILEHARDDAFALIKEDPAMIRPEHAVLQARLAELARRAELLRIG